MKTRSIVALAPLLFFAAACATETVDPELAETEVGETEGALARATPEGDTTTTATTTTASGLGGFDLAGLTPRPTPRVVSRTAAGATLTLGLDRALAADEVALAQMKVIVVRKENGQIVRKNLARSAALSADKKSVVVSLSEPVKAGEIYHPRGTWKPCSGSILGARCRVRPARFGQVLVQSRRTTPFAEVLPIAGADLQVLGTASKSAPSAIGTASPAPLATVTQLVLDEPAAPTQGTFRVKSMTPANLQRGVRRDVDRVVIELEGGTIDCARTGRGKEAFHMYTTTDGRMEQSMYDAPASEGLFRGTLRCEEDTNRLVFETPGNLLGDAWFKIELNAWSKEGNFMGNKVLEFETVRPGIQVLATRLENHYGGDETCDNDWFGTNYCDIYVTTAVASASQNETKRIPESGSYGGMKLFTSDPVSGSRNLGYGQVLFSRAEPIDELLQIKMWAHDADDDSSWKGIFSTAGQIAAAAGAALLPIRPDAGAIAEGLAAGFAGIAEAIPSNEDDTLGTATYNLTSSEGRWGTQSVGPTVIDISNGANNRGPVKVFLYTQEMPTSWRPIVVE
ncbi:MAG: hypothetical protein IPK71_11510 [Myxococcales bacterium]|nr:hypothetical protein [Myxococcales bacterium]